MKRILIVDDEDLVRETLADYLDSVGHAVEQADSGKKALKLIDETVFDLIILDIFMPELDGIEFIQLLGAKQSHPPIISISGGGGILPPRWSAKVTEAYGVALALTKPIDMNLFLSSVEDVLKSSRQTDAASS